MPLSLELKERAAAGRIAILDTPHGKVTTPTILPVVNPNINLIPAKEMRRLFGTEMVITNSYVIHKHKDLHEQALSSGVHKVIDWDGPVMTDSGTFQQYVYGDVTVGPEQIVQFQKDIGVDVGTVLDVFSTPERTFEQAREDLVETAARAKLSAAIKGDMALAATVQGGVYPILREESARLMTPHGDLFPIGGVVPLMERQMYPELARAIIGAKRGLPAGVPVHLFGAGHPLVFPLAAALGCDLFDSSAYAKFARDGRMMFADGTRSLADLTDSPCSCPVCSTYPVAELKRLDKRGRERLLAEHNLHVTFAELRRVRQAIRDGTLWELVEQRATGHPTMLAALDVLKEEPAKLLLERSEPISGNRAVFYTGPHTVHRPLFHRLHRRIRDNYRAPATERVVILPEGSRPFGMGHRDRIKHHLENHDAHFIVESWLGPLPIELEQVYPFAQSVVPGEVDWATRRHIAGLTTLLVEDRFPMTAIRDGEELEEWTFHTAEALYADPSLAVVETAGGPGIEAWDVDGLRIRAVADLQFGPGAATALFGVDPESVSYVRSRKNDRVRNVLIEGEHVASLRAEDGYFSLTGAGARRLHQGMQAPACRVQVSADSAPFNGEGKNVMAPFVESMDPRLRPGDDCIVVGPDDALVAHGRVLLTAYEHASYARGLAVRVREGLLK